MVLPSEGVVHCAVGYSPMGCLVLIPALPCATMIVGDIAELNPSRGWPSSRFFPSIHPPLGLRLLRVHGIEIESPVGRDVVFRVRGVKNVPVIRGKKTALAESMFPPSRRGFWAVRRLVGKTTPYGKCKRCPPRVTAVRYPGLPGGCLRLAPAHRYFDHKSLLGCAQQVLWMLFSGD